MGSTSRHNITLLFLMVSLLIILSSRIWLFFSKPMQSSWLMILRYALRNEKASNARSFPDSLRPLCLPLIVSFLVLKLFKQPSLSWPLATTALMTLPCNFIWNSSFIRCAKTQELISEENRHPHHHLSFLDVVLATSHPSASSSDQPRHICKYCKKPGHDISKCFRKQKDDKRKQHQSRGIFPRPKAAVVSSAPVDDLVVTVSQLETMFHRYMSQPSSALLVTSRSTDGQAAWDRHFLIFTSIAECFLGEAALTAVYTINCLLPLPLTRNLHLSYFMTNSQTIPPFECSVVLALSLFLPMNEINSNLDLGYVGFLGYVDCYPNLVRDSAPPPNSSDVPSLASSPAAGSPTSNLAPSTTSESPTDLRRSNWVRAPPSYLTDYHCYFTFATLHEPHTYREASTNPFWQQAMTDELDTLHKTHTWDMTTLPPSKYAEYDIDYEETFAPVARLIFVRSLLAVAAVRHLPLFQMDVKNAFLNNDLLKEVYMQPPPVYPDSQNQVCPLRGDDTAGIRDLQKFLCQQFEMKDLGILNYFLGLGVTSSSNGYYLSQVKYASDSLSMAGLTNSKTVSTPLELNVKLNAIDGEPLPDFFISFGTSRARSFMAFTSQHSHFLSCAPMLMQTSTEAEYRALADATSELLWLCWLLIDMGAPQITSTLIHCDNRSDIHIAHNDVFHERPKHIEIDCHFIRHHLQ
uniref:Reverse transcriptase Ty1/copia-type domain-containing protein n=1 Tax=Fagus sylvatica TaxID=28930 RepID=A0A2N9EQA7_FAGSY